MINSFMQKQQRSFIERMRRDHGLHQLMQSWVVQGVAQAKIAHDGRDGWFDARTASQAAEEALKLALSFILDNDGEYQRVCQERDQLLENIIKHVELTPRPIIVKLDKDGNPVCRVEEH